MQWPLLQLRQREEMRLAVRMGAQGQGGGSLGAPVKREQAGHSPKVPQATYLCLKRPAGQEGQEHRCV